MSRKFTGSKLLFWLITGVFVLVCSIVLGIIPGILYKGLSLLGNIGGAILYLFGGIILVIGLIILGVAALFGVKHGKGRVRQ